MKTLSVWIHIALYYAMNLKSYPGILIPQINDVCVGILTRRDLGWYADSSAERA